MPEGDAVRRTARRLDHALAGQVLTRAELRVPRFATVDLRGLTVIGTHAVGKHMLTRLVGRGRALTLHSHLLLDGSWRTGPVGPAHTPQHEIRAWLANAERQAVGVRVHRIDLRPTTQEHVWVGHLGPDIMGEDFQVVMAAALLKAASEESTGDRNAEPAQQDRPGTAASITARPAELRPADDVSGGADTHLGMPARPRGRGLVEVLLDQAVVCGLGTMWASELAATIRRDPVTPVSDVPSADLVAGLDVIRERMLRALDEPHVTRRRALLVFERAGQPCRRCGGPIRRGRVGAPSRDRPTYWCPSCQP